MSEATYWPFDKHMRNRLRMVILGLSKKQVRKLLVDMLNAMDVTEETWEEQIEKMKTKMEKEGAEVALRIEEPN